MEKDHYCAQKVEDLDYCPACRDAKYPTVPRRPIEPNFSEECKDCIVYTAFMDLGVFSLGSILEGKSTIDERDLGNMAGMPVIAPKKHVPDEM